MGSHLCELCMSPAPPRPNLLPCPAVLFVVVALFEARERKYGICEISQVGTRQVARLLSDRSSFGVQVFLMVALRRRRCRRWSTLSFLFEFSHMPVSASLLLSQRIAAKTTLDHQLHKKKRRQAAGQRESEVSTLKTRAQQEVVQHAPSG
jgi:hypothetical protein